MAEHERMLKRDARPPGARAVEAWLGPRATARWREVTRWIDDTYPETFTPDWIYGGERHGWALRYRKGRSFLTLVPERGRAMAVIVLGREDRVAVEGVLPRLAPATRAAYRAAPTFADGKWLGLPLGGKQGISDVMAILSLKRPPRTARTGRP
jgi:hypothetical protein